MIRALLLRKHLNGLLESSSVSAAQKADIKKILKSSRGMRELKNQLQAQAKREGKLVGKIGDGKIIEWLLAHQEQILAFIRMIIGLFS